MKTCLLKFLFVVALFGILNTANASVPVYLTIYNVGTSSFTVSSSVWIMFSGGSCSDYVSQGEASGNVTIPAGTSSTVVFNWPPGYSWNAGACVSSPVQLSGPTFSGVVIGTQSTAPFTISYNAGSGVLVTNYSYTAPPTQTNVTQCILNNSGHSVTANASVGGVVIATKILAPWEQWCVTATLKLDGSSGNFDMGYTINPLDAANTDPNNPFATNGMNSDFSVTNGFSSTNFTPINPSSGYTNVTTGGGGSVTNTTTIGATNFSSVLWTNNINYPNTGTAGDARDSTLRAGFGALHADNGVAMDVMKLISQNWDGMRTLATMMTNELGQVIAAVYHQTNSDQMPVYINSMTNNATANQQALKSQLQADTAAITNAIANGGNSSQMTNLNNTMGGISNLFSQITDMTNADIATETTQSGMSNLLAGIRSNQTNGSFLSTNGFGMTNYAKETTLGGISNLLASWGTNGSTTNSYSVPGTATNVVAATAAATSIFLEPLGVLADTITSLTTPPNIGEDPSGGGSVWHMNFCGRDINLDPVAMFPSVVAFSIGIWKFLLVAAYLGRIGWLYMKVVQTYATAQTGGVPNMDVFGGGGALTINAFFGGNFVGFMVAVLVPALFLGIWLVVVTIMIVPLGEFVGIYNAIGSVFAAARTTGPGEVGLHLLFALFPVALFVQLTSAWILMQLTLAQATLIASSASRFLFGK